MAVDPNRRHYATYRDKPCKLTANHDTLNRTLAKSFSAELMDIFRIENSVADLDNQVDQRYDS